MSTRRRTKPPADAGLATGAAAERQLRSFIAKFAPADQRLIRAVRTAMRRRLPTAHELVYDNYNFFVIGYGPTARPSEAVLSIAARANRVAICFIHGAKLPDPKRLLVGSGKQVRFLRVETAAMISRPDVEALLAAAVARSKVAFPERGRGPLVIRAVSAKQRPRRSPTARAANSTAKTTARSPRTRS